MFYILVCLYEILGAGLKRFIMASVTIEASLKEIVETFSSFWYFWQ